MHDETTSKFDGLFGRRQSYESCYYQPNPQKSPISRIFQEDAEIFTISSTSSPVYNNNQALAKLNFLDSIELSMRPLYQKPVAHRKLRQPSSSLLKPPSNLIANSNFFDSSLSSSTSSGLFTMSTLDLHEETDTCSLILDDKKDYQNCMISSFDSGFTSIDMSDIVKSTDTQVATTKPFNTSYLVMIQPSKTGRQSMFKYLFDLSDMIKDTFFQWSGNYLGRIKQTVISYVFTSGNQNMLGFKTNVTKSTTINDNNMPSNMIDKPFSIMSLLGKLNIFNLFRGKTTENDSHQPNCVGFTPLRQFFLRLFDINFF